VFSIAAGAMVRVYSDFIVFADVCMLLCIVVAVAMIDYCYVLQAGAGTSEETALVPYVGPPETMHHMLVDPSHVHKLYSEVTAERGIIVPADLDLNEEAGLLEGVSVACVCLTQIFNLLTYAMLHDAGGRGL
jgi:hypothetical protein